MLVTVNASDLAAVGADPVGLLICETLPPDASDEWIAALQRGIAEAAEAHGLPVLGGDTNAGRAPHLAATAVGLVHGRVLTRCGARPGHLLFASGPLGAGGAYALTRLVAPGNASGASFQPIARLREGALLRHIASACMDTSDGAIATLDELMIRNGVGLRIESPVEAWTEPGAIAVVRTRGLSPWMLHAGPHGEFELLFTVAAEHEQRLHAVAGTIGWHPIRLGTVTLEPGLVVTGTDGSRRLDATAIRNLFAECGGDVGRYVRELAGMVSKD
jgi:thiamine-monophosphate kinase